jgi:putative transposase
VSGEETATAATVPSLTELSEQARAQAVSRYAVLRPHLEDGVALTSAGRQAGVPLRMAQRWLAAYRASGLAGLARARRSDQGSRSLPDRWWR